MNHPHLYETFHFAVPVSIKVQNVTGDAIQFSWTGGRRGSLHTISLMDGNLEINKTTTNETKTVFEHLLPGHVYTVSVEAQSCAQDSRTSVTVRTGISTIILSFLFNEYTLKISFCNMICI